MDFLQMIFGRKLIFGFSGTDPDDPSVQKMRQCLKEGQIGGIILFSRNIDSRSQIRELIASFREAGASPGVCPWISVDQEGGHVQRLIAEKGFSPVPSAQKIASSYTPEQAFFLYYSLAQDLKDIGCTLNFGPVLDLNPSDNSGQNQPCPVIGGLGRSYGSDCPTVVSYAQTFVKAHQKAGIRTCLKHFPGHGYAQGDTHLGFVDVTDTYSACEEEPFQKMVEQGAAESMMISHLINRHVDETYPASLSRPTLQRLRQFYDGVTISDDLHMGSIAHYFTAEQILTQTLRAEVDLLIFSNNPKASGNRLSFEEPWIFASRLHEIFHRLYTEGKIDPELLKKSDRRITAFAQQGK